MHVKLTLSACEKPCTRSQWLSNERLLVGWWNAERLLQRDGANATTLLAALRTTQALFDRLNGGIPAAQTGQEVRVGLSLV